MARHLRIAAPLLLAMSLLAACDRLEPPAAKRVAQVQASDAGTDRGGSDQYFYEIRYAALPPQDAPLATAIRAFGDQQKREFLAHFGEEGPLPEGAEPREMHLDFEVRAQSANFVSVLGSGETYSGGDHGNPLLASFVLHRPSRRVLALPELFVNAEAGLRVLSAEARRVLRERHVGGGSNDRRIDDGTAPKAENYTIFLVDGAGGDKAKGLIVIFPAYQVATYAQGSQEVNVPAARFRDLLKPEFKSAFAATAAK